MAASLILATGLGLVLPSAIQAQVQGSGQDLPTPKILIVIEVLTPTNGFNLEQYLNGLYNTVKQRADATMPKPVQLGDQGIVVVRCKLRKDGTLDAKSVKTRSKTDKSLDQHATSSIRNSGPFDPLPAAFSAPEIDLRFSFFYNTGVAMHSASTPYP